MDDIRIGIVGHGFMGHEHEKMLTKMDGIRVVGISDIDPKQLEDVQEGIKRYASNDELMHDPEVDVVLIAANNNQHYDLVVQAAKAGKDIICEKPVAMTTEELDGMIAVTKECGVKFTVHHQRRLDPDFRTMKAVFDQGSLGKVYSIKSGLYGFNGNMHDWHVYKKEGGGMLYDKWFERHWMIGGNQGSAYVDGFEPEGKIVRTTHLLQNVSGQRTMTAAGPTRSFGPPAEGTIVTEPLPTVTTCHEDYFENYKKAYRGEEEFLVKVEETRRVLALMEAVRESARTGQSVAFE